MSPMPLISGARLAERLTTAANSSSVPDAGISKSSISPARSGSLAVRLNPVGQRTVLICVAVHGRVIALKHFLQDLLDLLHLRVFQRIDEHLLFLRRAGVE